jgi:CheY-like chemotaxis protein
MFEIRAALIVDSSDVLLEILRAMLRPHAQAIFSATSCAEALERMDRLSSLDLLICDVRLPDADGFQVLERARLSSSGTKVVMTTASRSEEEFQRVQAAGAVGYLPKPIRLTDLEPIFRELSPQQAVNRNKRVGRMAEAHLVDPAKQDGLVVLKVRNLSMSGAFLETQGPLPVGHVMDLEIALANHVIQVRAEVVRVQEPSWFYPGGVGIHFHAMDEASQQELESAVRVISRVESEINRRRRQHVAAKSGGHDS